MPVVGQTLKPSGSGPMVSDCQLRRDPGLACSRFLGRLLIAATSGSFDSEEPICPGVALVLERHSFSIRVLVATVFPAKQDLARI